MWWWVGVEMNMKGGEQCQFPCKGEIQRNQRGLQVIVMVCAHRYVRKGKDYQWGQGMCYTLTQYLDYDETWEPCKGRPVNKAHEQYGYCQAGTSGVLLNDTAVIGTPGPYTWRGTVYVISVSDDFLNRDKTLYFGPLTDTDYPVDKYSYLGEFLVCLGTATFNVGSFPNSVKCVVVFAGMSVTAGKFLGNTLSYAAGAPRSNGTGQVVIFVHQPPTNPMKVQLILNGEQFASSFGYEITNADVNGDKLPDLIVGAPFYFSLDRGGAVYIYMNNPEHCLECSKPVKLTGKLESRFGFSIACLGDLNKDGFDDIAIGAPYEDEGVVYIYLGSSNGILTTPSQNFEKHMGEWGLNVSEVPGRYIRLVLGPVLPVQSRQLLSRPCEQAGLVSQVYLEF
ncbi:hypothetical protein PR048_019672 [Dryococelus australis]|uniref:Uncharacterized protein n=1 Tax=Dryococelus australis TaxID=614101 RepID=A0ABQ9H4E3_9NEOP|nr:hypothetical protein PR048_019672 [Dryococelus australis]